MHEVRRQRWCIAGAGAAAGADRHAAACLGVVRGRGRGEREVARHVQIVPADNEDEVVKLCVA